MANILDVLTRALSLRQETALNSITPDRAGGIMYDTLILINQMQLEGGSLLISKVYSSVAAMEADTTPTSDLTGRALRPGQLAVIVPSSSTSSDMGSVYRYNEPGSWTLCGKIGGLPMDTVPTEGSTNGITSGAVFQTKQALEGEVSQLEAKVTDLTDEYILTPIPQSGTTRYYIKTDVAVGETVDLTEVMSGSYADFKHYIKDCVPGDVFVINGTGTASGELWCFVDADNKKISSSVGVAGSDLQKVAPAGAAKIIINDRTGNGTQYTKVRGTIPAINDRIGGIDNSLADTQTNVSEIESEVFDITKKVGINNYDDVAFSADYLIWTVSGDKVIATTSSYSNQRIVTPIAIQKGAIINVSQSILGPANKAIIADDEDNVIAVVTYQQNVNGYVVPEGATRMYINRASGTAFSCRIQFAYSAELDKLVQTTDQRISEVEGEVFELNKKIGEVSYDGSEFSSENSVWVISGNSVVSSASSFTNQRILQPIIVTPGSVVTIEQSVIGEPKRAIFADGNGVVVSFVNYSVPVTDYVVPNGATRMYINRAKNTAYSCTVKSAEASRFEQLVSTPKPSELPVYAPLPQPGARGEDGTLDAENSTSTDIFDAIDTAIENYGRYAFGEVLGKDATNTYDIKRYSLCRADLFAWRASSPFYAWEYNGATFYIKTCSPYVGAEIYDSSRASVVATVASFDSTSGVMTDTNNNQYTRVESSNIVADVIYTIRESFSFDFDIYTKSGSVITRLTKTVWDSETNTITYNEKSYVRSRVDDWGRNTKETIVIWANEHAAQSDPHECAIICYRLIRDLCQSGPSGNKFLSFLKNFCKVIIIPVVNPYGLNNYAINKNTGGRLNGNGVNLNRNYPTTGWIAGSAGNYGGSYGGSERETQYVMNTCIEFGANVGIDIHCLGYVTEANEGACAYGGNGMTASNAGTNDIDLVINSMLSDFSIKLQNYGEASATGEGEGKNWLLANGIEGGLIEMNAGSYALQYNGKQHSGFILGADYTLLLRLLNLWSKRYNEDLALSNFEIS